MPSFSAKPKKSTTKPKSIVFVIYPNITLLDLAGPLQVFTCANAAYSGDEPYITTVVSLDGEKTDTNTGVPLDAEPMSIWSRRSIDTLIVVGGDGAFAATQNHRFVTSVNTLIRRASRVCSVCSGAFVLAESGILDNRRAVTHWSDCDMLSRTWPRVKVEIDPIFVKDNHVWTSAGITAGIDMALALVAEDLGRSTALKVARTLVTYMVRPGGQSQFSPALNRQAEQASHRFNDLHDWISSNLDCDLRVERLADQVNMSTRNFSRVYTAEMGQTPAKTVETLRIEAARHLLETTSLAIAVVAARCGFIDDERMRRAFVRTLQISPNDYRRRFQLDPP